MTSAMDQSMKATAAPTLTLRDFRKNLGAGARVSYRGIDHTVAGVADAGPVLGRFVALVPDGSGSEPVWAPMIEVFKTGGTK